MPHLLRQLFLHANRVLVHRLPRRLLNELVVTRVDLLVLHPSRAAKQSLHNGWIVLNHPRYLGGKASQRLRERVISCCIGRRIAAAAAAAATAAAGAA